MIAVLAITALAGAALALTVALGAQLFQGSTSIAGAARCLARGNHEPMRHPLGGFRCRRCGLPGADLGEFDMARGWPAGGHVGPQRRTFTRKNGEITRSDW